MKNFLPILFIATFALNAYAQKKNENYRLNIQKTKFPVTVDGLANEEAWKHTDLADDFFMVLPMDTAMAVERSEIRMTYDDEHIYLLGIFYKSKPGTYYVESLRRDFSFGKNDNFLFFIDPFNNQTTGFSFGSNAMGAQWDGTMYGGGKVDLNWDSKWISKVIHDDEKWVIEMAIPFKSIRYKKGVTEWGINFSRLDLGSSEKSSWTPIPRQFPTASLAYTGVLVWDQPPPTPRFNYSIIPYALGGITNDLDDETSYETKIGGDVKISLSSSLNLDLTVNPDFSQVEVDRQVTNLDRYELFYPEKRQFFLENADLFASYGYPVVRPFFSRRIGLGIPIIAGARLSGNLNEKWRMGIMDIQTDSDEDIGLPSQNFGVFSIQRQVFTRSSIGLLFVNKESLNYPVDNDSLRSVYPEFNRNLGLEYNLASPSNLWTGKAFLFKSFSPDKKGDGITQALNVEYKTKKWNWGVQQQYVQDSYTAEVGYVPRTGYINISPFAGYLFFPDKGKVLSHGPKLSTSVFFNEDMERTDQLNLVQYLVNFRNRSDLAVSLVDEYVELLQPFDPTNSGKDSLQTGTKHHWNAIRMKYNSKPQSMFTYTVNTRFGGYYENGNRTNITAELGYRFQPYVSLSSNLSYNYISLPEPWNVTQFWLIGSEIDITFTNKLFFATLFQYNEQTKNFNLNSRFQWRYKPASDIFLVYSNNHLLPPYSGRTSSITLKITYWFNR